MSNDSIAICGVSGRFPNCDNVEAFKSALLNNVDLITQNHARWPHEAFETPSAMGLLKDVDKFDAAFFGLNPTQSDFHDPRRKYLTEVTYEAILDAGINPQQLRGSDTGVFVASVSAIFKDDVTAASVLPNAISYSFDFKGPSMSIDTSCSSSLYAVHQAVQAINSGLCEKAIVCTARLQLDPYNSIFFTHKGVLSKEGKCKVFSEDRDGYVKSEAIVAILIEKVKTAKRIYATIEGIGVNVDGYKEDGLFHPSFTDQVKAMQDTYQRFKINPDDVTYVEAHGTATLVGDVEECTGLNTFFNRTRNNPLLIGSVKSNVGHTEYASGLVSVVKALITFHEGKIPANLHCSKPSSDVPGIKDGTLKVVTSNTVFDGGLFAINSFGLGGANGHLVLRPFVNPKSSAQSCTNRLMLISGRTEEGVKLLAQKILENQTNEEFLEFIDNIFKISIPQHSFRGFMILGPNHTCEILNTISQKRPVWFVFSGMGSQWPGMARDFMQIEAFNNTFQKCCHVLNQFGINLENIVTTKDSNTFQNIINSFVAITAMQLCLTDVLYSFGIRPDNIIGHSMGEVACAYADGSLTVEQAMLISYARGFAAVESKPPAGLMAVCAISKEECEKLLPNDVYIACFNSKTNVTISGSADSVENFVNKLNDRNIFARSVYTGHIAFHSKYIKNAGLRFLEFVKENIPDPKPRSAKWLSSTFEESNWNEEVSKYCSAEYFQQNYHGQVIFQQLFKFIPSDAILIEVSPKGILQSVLKEDAHKNATVVSLLHPDTKNNVACLLSNIGRLYLAGAQPKLAENKVAFPVDAKTPMISSLIKWNRDYKWPFPYFSGSNVFCELITIDMSSTQYNYLDGHVVSGKNLFPGTGYIELIWRTFGRFMGKAFDKLPIVIENIKFERMIFITSQTDKINFKIFLLKSSGFFEIIEGDSVVASGRIFCPEDINNEFTKRPYPSADKSSYKSLTSDDIYNKELRLRGYDYTGLFRGIVEAENNFQQITLAWKDNWSTFLDTMLQCFLLNRFTTEFLLPTKIRQLTIDPQKHLNCFINNKVKLTLNDNMRSFKAGGVEIRELHVVERPRFGDKNEPALIKNVFIPYKSSDSYGLDDLYFFFYVSLQIIKDDVGEEVNYSTVEIFEDRSACVYQDMFQQVSNDIFTRNTITFETLSARKLLTISRNYVLLMTQNLFVEKDFMKYFNSATYVFTETNLCISQSYLDSLDIVIVFQHVMNQKQYFLLKRPAKISLSDSSVIEIKNNDFSWVEDVKSAINKNNDDNSRIFLTTRENDVGVVGLFNCLCREISNVTFRVFICATGPKFSFNSNVYHYQMKKDLAVNVYKNQMWGSYKYLPLEDPNKRNLSHASLKPTISGDLSSLQWVEKPINCHESADLVKVCYSALNFRDVLLASGKMSEVGKYGENDIGYEYSGIDKNGRRVMGWLQASGSLSTYLQPESDLIWEVPPNWTLAQAATVPVVYLTTYYGMIIRGCLQKGETVLVHAGTGGVGLAAITLALKMNCQVFVTVGNEAKKKYLKQKFPSLYEKNIGNSRDISFEEFIMNETNGKGVDLVLNSLANELFQASLRCMKKFGRFIEIGRQDLANDPKLETGLFAKNCSFHGIYLLDRSLSKLLGSIFKEGIKNKLFEPLDYTIFNYNEAAEAFKFLYGSKHIGKVLIKVSPEEKFTEPAKILALPRTYMDPNKSYIIVGGLGGFGLELAKWLVERGARVLVLNTRRPPSTGFHALALRKFEENGIVVKISNEDCSTEEGTRNLIISSNKLGPVGGIINAALVLSDALFEKQTKEKFEEVNKPKFRATNYLDKITRQLCPCLDHFVVFTSFANGMGTIGLSNYAFTNSSIELICYNRRAENLPGLAIQFGPIKDIGYVQNLKDQNQTIAGDLAKLTPQSLISCIRVLDNCLQNESATVVLSFLYSQETSKTDRVSLADTISKIFGIKLDSIKDKSTKLVHLGLDSLTTFEIKTLLSKNYDLELNINEVKKLTLEDIERISAA